MLKPKIVVAVALGVLGTWSVRSASAEPAWCKGGSFDRDLDLRDLSSPDAEKAVVTFAHAACAPTAEARARLADIEKTRAAWGKRLGMTDADWADVIAWKATGEGRNLKPERSTKDLTQYTPIDQYLAFVDGFPSLDGYGGDFENPVYLADIFDITLSEVGRYAYIESCLAATTSVASKAPPAATWALCQHDVERFDLAKFHAELRADKAHPGDIKMKLRFQAMDLKKRLAAHAENVQKAWKQDPVYKRMFEISAAARTEWASGLGTNHELLALVQKMNAAIWSKSRKAMEGCEAPTTAALLAAVGKVPASTFKGMKDQRYDPSAGFAAAAGPALMTFPEASLAAEAYIMCHKDGGTSNFLYEYLTKTSAFRGPRTMGFARMLSEKLTLDDVDEKIYWPDNRRPYRRQPIVASAGGVVAKTTIEGDKVVVKLEKLIEKSYGCVKSHYGKKILRINANGSVDYELICDEEGVLEWDQTWSDFNLDKKWAPLLEKGVKFSVSGGDVIATWPNGKSETPNWFLGVKLK